MFNIGSWPLRDSRLFSQRLESVQSPESVAVRLLANVEIVSVYFVFWTQINIVTLMRSGWAWDTVALGSRGSVPANL